MCFPFFVEDLAHCTIACNVERYSPPKHTKNLGEPCRRLFSVYHVRGLPLVQAKVSHLQVAHCAAPKSRAGRETETYRLPLADRSTFIILYLSKALKAGSYWFSSTGDLFFLLSCVPTNPPSSISSWIYNQFLLCKSGYDEMYLKMLEVVHKQVGDCLIWYNLQLACVRNLEVICSHCLVNFSELTIVNESVSYPCR